MMEQQIQRLQSENKLLTEFARTVFNLEYNPKVDSIDKTANEILVKRGIIVKRASGYYPSLDYDGSNMLVSATCVAYNGFVNYVRYTPTGIEHLVDLFSKLGYKLKEV